MIDDLFELSRLEAGDLHWSIEQVEVGELVEDAVAAMRSRPRRTGSRSPPSRDRPCAARADPEKLQRVLFNLIQNAIRHTPADGSVTVRAEPAGEWSRSRSPTPGGGSRPHERERVFEPFVRGGGARRADLARGRPRRDGGPLSLYKLNRPLTWRAMAHQQLWLLRHGEAVPHESSRTSSAS